MAALPTNWREELRRCNFRLAQREIGEFLRTTNREAKAQGGYFAVKKEFVDGWEKFSAKPCYETAMQFLENAPEYAPTVFNYFLGCCPGGRFYRTGFMNPMRFRLGDYRLGVPLKDIEGLMELSKEEYAVFGRDSLQEVVYHANPTEFIGHRWNMMIGATEGKVYQLAASLELRACSETRELTDNIFKHCELQLGTPTEEQPGLFVWDTSGGSVMFQFAIIVDVYAANIFVSSDTANRWGKS